MKRYGVLLAGTLLSAVIGGCGGGGLEEGPPTGPVSAESAQPADFKAEMKRNAEKMKNAKKPAKKAAPAAPPAPDAEK
jgi:hypothetical protein